MARRGVREPLVDEWYTDFLRWEPKPQRRQLRDRNTVLQKEARVIGLITEVLEALPRESRERVLAWLGSAYALGSVEPPRLAKAPEPVKPGPSTPALSPAASAAPLLVKAAAPEVKPPEPQGTYQQRRRKTARTKL